MVDQTKRSFDKNNSIERRQGFSDRRVLVTNGKHIHVERRVGMPDRIIATVDRDVHVITEDAEYKGTINLNSVPENCDRISVFFKKQ